MGLTKQLKIVEDITFEDNSYAPTEDQLNYMCSQVGPEVPRYIVASTMKFHNKNPYYLKYGVMGRKQPTSKQIREAKRSHLESEVLPEQMNISSLEKQRMTQSEANEYVRKQIEDYENTRQKQIFLDNNNNGDSKAISIGAS